MVLQLNRLSCFESTKYYLNCPNPYDNQCIAPAGHGGQCRVKIRSSTLRELTKKFIASNNRADQDKLLREIVLARCCGRWHEWKLAGSENVLKEVCSRYEDYIRAVSDAASVDDTICGSVSPDKESLNRLAQPYRAQPRRSERISSRLDSYYNTEAPSNLFVPYSSCHFGDVESRLMTPLTDRGDGFGWVYGFALPGCPGFVKIGSCKSSPAARLSAWLKCHPKAKLIHAIVVPFCKRAEQLIHRELSRQRHKMISCQQCSRTHLEWFKVSVEKARSVMDSWEELLTMWSPYLKDGTVAPEWRLRLGRTRHDLTAKRLLGICTAEKALEHPMKATDILRKTKEKPLAAASRLGKCAINLQRSKTIQALLTCSIDWDMVMVYFYDFWRLT